MRGFLSRIVPRQHTELPPTPAPAHAPGPFPAAPQMAPGTPAPAHTASPTTRPRPDRDHRASLRTLHAARLLRRGEDLDTVAALTDVPVALLELIQADQPHTPATHGGSPPHRSGDHLPCGAGSRRSSSKRRQSSRS